MPAAALRCRLCSAPVHPGQAPDDVTWGLDLDGSPHRCPPASRRPAGRHTAATATPPPRPGRLVGEAPPPPTFVVTVNGVDFAFDAFLPAHRLASRAGATVTVR